MWQLFQDWTKRVRRRKVAAQDYRFLTYQLHSPQLSILLAEVAVTAKNHFLMKPDETFLLNRFEFLPFTFFNHGNQGVSHIAVTIFTFFFF